MDCTVADRVDQVCEGWVNSGGKVGFISVGHKDGQVSVGNLGLIK